MGAEKLYKIALVIESDDKKAIAGLKRFIKTVKQTEKATDKGKEAGGRWGRTMQSLTKGSAELTRGMGGLGMAARALNHPLMAVGAIVAGLTREIVKSVKEFIPFRDEIKRIQILLKDDLSPSMQAAQMDIQDVAMTTGQSLKVISAALKEDVRASHNYVRSMKLVTESSKLATVAQQDLGEVTQLGRTIMETFTEYKGKEKSLVDKLTTSWKTSRLELDRMSSSVGRVLPMFKAAGGTLDEFLAIMSVATKQTRKTQEAVTGLRAFLYVLGLESKRPIEGMARLGLAFGAEAARVKGLTRYMKDLSKAMATAPGSVLKTMMDSITAIEGGNVALQILSKEGMADFDYMLGRLQASQGETNLMFRETAGLWGVLGNRAKMAGSVIRTSFADMITTQLAPGLENLSIWLERNKNEFRVWGRAIADIFMRIGALMKTVFRATPIVLLSKVLSRFFGVMAKGRARGPAALAPEKEFIAAFKGLGAETIAPLRDVIKAGKGAPAGYEAAGRAQIRGWAEEQRGKPATGAPGTLGPRVPSIPSPAAPPPPSLTPETQINRMLLEEIKGMRVDLEKSRGTTVIEIDGETIARVVETKKLEAMEDRGMQPDLGIQSDLAAGLYS